MSAGTVPAGGRLVLVSTPIGNLEDLTVRALKTLAGCDAVLAEDTRRTRALLASQGIERPVERLDDHVVGARLGGVLRRISEGARLALVSDAGTPLVSDPGAALVRAVLDAGLALEVVPGASAVLAALALSGLGGGGFRFVGFLPRGGPARRVALLALARDPLPTVLFEAPDRVHGTLGELLAVCGPGRRAAVNRELTKVHEECLRDSLEKLLERTESGVRGEVTVVVDGRPELAEESPEEALDAALDAALASGMGPSDAAREVARALGLKRAEVYRRCLARGAGG
ncbi:MAG: 16S rRNA (cytidine(1402)-2'-O)-methyltransferase [Deltaproteobacteria bacterium]|nr:16S rRNA (cytidine(1402)-2'-O)-methyltransferase [Deltaproteobacteria bacterium]